MNRRLTKESDPNITIIINLKKIIRNDAILKNLFKTKLRLLIYT